MLAVAQQKLGDNNISYACGSADDTDFITHLIQTHKIDMIVSNLCFQWLDDQDFYIQTYHSYAPIYISVLLENSFYQWYKSVITQAPNFKPPISLLPNHITDKIFEYHIRYDNGLDFLRSQKKLGTLITKTKPLSVKQIKQACTIFENNYDATISYYLGYVIKIQTSTIMPYHVQSILRDLNK
jgi:hypothetical protein